jgi:hypothetical protein
MTTSIRTRAICPQRSSGLARRRPVQFQCSLRTKPCQQLVCITNHNLCKQAGSRAGGHSACPSTDTVCPSTNAWRREEAERAKRAPDIANMGACELVRGRSTPINDRAARKCGAVAPSTSLQARDGGFARRQRLRRPQGLHYIRGISSNRLPAATRRPCAGGSAAAAAADGRSASRGSKGAD